MSTGPVSCTGWVVPMERPRWEPDAALLTSDISIPPPSPTQVRVRVHAAGVNPVDWKRVTFAPKSNTGVAGAIGSTFQGMRHPPPHFPFPYTVGVDGAGEVESVGSDVKQFRVGDRVVFHSGLAQRHCGSFCEYALIDADVLVSIPANGTARTIITYEEAAAIPCASWTAYVALMDKLRIEGGRSIMINGASGGVGSTAVQLAHYFGLFVFAACSPASAEYVKGLGADVVVDYRDPNAMVDAVLAQTNGYGVDYLFEVENGDGAEIHLEMLRFGGAACLISGVLVPHSDALFRRQLSVHYVFLNGMIDHPLTRSVFKYTGEQVMRLYADGAFHLTIEVLPFDKGAEALTRLAENHKTRGKLVLKIA